MKPLIFCVTLEYIKWLSKKYILGETLKFIIQILQRIKNNKMKTKIKKVRSKFF
jgi:hypothetical protein